MWLANTSRGGNLTPSLGSLFQFLATLSTKKLFLIFNLNILWRNWIPFPLALSLVPWEKRLTPTRLQPPCREQCSCSEVTQDRDIWPCLLSPHGCWPTQGLLTLYKSMYFLFVWILGSDVSLGASTCEFVLIHQHCWAGELFWLILQGKMLLKSSCSR